MQGGVPQRSVVCRDFRWIECGKALGDGEQFSVPGLQRYTGLSGTGYCLLIKKWDFE